MFFQWKTSAKTFKDPQRYYKQNKEFLMTLSTCASKVSWGEKSKYQRKCGHTNALCAIKEQNKRLFDITVKQGAEPIWFCYFVLYSMYIMWHWAKEEHPGKSILFCWALTFFQTVLSLEDMLVLWKKQKYSKFIITQ